MAHKLIYEKMSKVETSLWKGYDSSLSCGETRATKRLLRNVKNHLRACTIWTHYRLSPTFLQKRISKKNDGKDIEQAVVSLIGLEKINAIAMHAQKELPKIEEKLKNVEIKIEMDTPILAKKERRSKFLRKVLAIPLIASTCALITGATLALIPFIRNYSFFDVEKLNKTLWNSPTYNSGMDILVSSIPFVLATGLLVGVVDYFCGVEIKALKKGVENLKESTNEINQSLSDLIETTSAYFKNK